MARKLEVQIAGDASSLSKALKSATDHSSRFGSALGTLAKTSALAAGAAGIGAVAFTLKAGISEYIQASQVAAQTNAVIKSTGGIANVTAKQVDTLATALMRKSGVDDEVIKSGENVLLAFTHIRNEVGKGNDIFNRATAAALDFSVRTGRDMPQAALALGKALEDPATKMAGLSKAGIIFTDAQKKMVQHMVETGHTMDAQKFILGELEKRYGGAADAAGKTLPGQLKILREEFNNFAGDLVARAVPALMQFTGFLNKFSAATTVHAKLEVVWEGLQDVGGKLVDALKEAFTGHDTKVRVDLNEWVEIHHEGVVEKMRADLSARVKAVDWSAVFVGMFESINWGALLSATFHAIISISKTQWEIVAAVWLGAWRAIFTGLQAAGVQIVGAVTSAMGQVVGAVRSAAGSALAAAVALGASIATGARQGVAGVVAAVRDKVNDIPGAVRGFVGAALAAGASVGRAVMEGIGQGLSALAGAVADRAVALIHGIVSRIKAAAGIHSPSELFALEVGHPLALGIIRGFERGLQTDTLLRPLRAAKQGLDDFVGSDGVANMTMQGGKLRDALEAGFAGATLRTTPAAVSGGFLHPVAGPIAEPRVRSASPDGAVVVNLNVNGSVMAERDLVETVRSGIITGLRRGALPV